MNSIVISGNLTRDSEVRFTPSGASVISMDIAVNDDYKDAKGEWIKRCYFIKADYWGKNQDVIVKYLLKGKTVLISGKLIVSEWEKDGQKHKDYKINAFTVNPLEKMSGNNTASNQQPQQTEDSEDVPF